MWFDIKPHEALGFTALRAPFHWGPYHRAPPVQGNPRPRLHHHRFLRVLAAGKPPHLVYPVYSNMCPTLGLHNKPASGALSSLGKFSPAKEDFTKPNKFK